MKNILISLIILIFIGIIFLNLPDLNDKETGPQEPINITFTGDVMLGRGVDYTLHQDPHPFAGVINLTNGTDLTVINLESPITYATEKAPKEINFKADPQFTPIFKEEGVDVACLANNHIMDFGQAGFNDTIKNLKKNNIMYVGVGKNITEAYKPLIVNVKGKKLAIIQASEFTDEYSMPPATESRPGFAPISWGRIKSAIDNAKAKGANYIICEFHYGNEYRYTPNNLQRGISHKCIDNGAFIVIGHHPHVPGSVEKYKGNLIFYSLGNCVFDQKSPETRVSMIIILNIKENSSEVYIYPIEIVSNYPQLMDEDDATRFLQNLQSYSINTTIKIRNGIGIIRF